MSVRSERLHRLTTARYERMAEGGLLPERGIELIDGLVVEMSPKGTRHGYAVTSLNEQFVLQARERYRVYADALSLRLGPRDELDPDIALARTSRNYARERPGPGEVALIVEVADSSLANDLGRKLRMYARAAIAEYWVVELRAERIHLFRGPSGETYLERREARADETISPAAYPDVAIDVRQVFGSAS